MSASAWPNTVDVDIYQGDDFSMTLTVTNPDGSAANLTGATAAAQIRSAPASTDIAATFTTTIASNVVTLTLTHTAATALSGNYVWDCQLTYSGGTVNTIAAGRVRVAAEVTR
jgi:hypothetical protein